MRNDGNWSDDDNDNDDRNTTFQIRGERRKPDFNWPRQSQSVRTITHLTDDNKQTFIENNKYV